MKIVALPKEGRRFVWTIFIDDEPWVDTHTKIFGNSPNFPICETLEQFKEKFFALEYAKAKKYAMDRLAARSYPSVQLQKLLARNLVSSATIQKLVLEFTRLGYLNDDEWIDRFVKGQASRNIGKQKIVYKLASKGISPKLAEERVSQLLNQADAQKSIRHLMQTKYKNRNLSVFKEKQKVFAALVRKGFDIETIKQTVYLE